MSSLVKWPSSPEATCRLLPEYLARRYRPTLPDPRRYSGWLRRHLFTVTLRVTPCRRQPQSPIYLTKKGTVKGGLFSPASGGAVQNGAGFNNPLLQYATGTPPRLRDSYHAPSRPKEMSCRFRHCLDNTGSNRVIADLVNQDKGPGDGILVITVTHQRLLQRELDLANIVQAQLLAARFV